MKKRKHLFTLVDGDTIAYSDIKIVGSLCKSEDGVYFIITLTDKDAVIVTSRPASEYQSSISTKIVKECNEDLLDAWDEYIEAMTQDDDL